MLIYIERRQWLTSELADVLYYLYRLTTMGNKLTGKCAKLIYIER